MVRKVGKVRFRRVSRGITKDAAADDASASVPKRVEESVLAAAAAAAKNRKRANKIVFRLSVVIQLVIILGL